MTLSPNLSATAICAWEIFIFVIWIAILCAASDYRQVPDTQEVFLSEDSDNSIIFEILQVVTEGPAATDLREAVK